jgi:cold shock CspA family protein
MRCLDDLNGALVQLKEGALIDPLGFELQLETARVHLYLRNYEEAKNSLEPLLLRANLAVWGRRKIYDLYLQVFQRQAENLESHHDNVGALCSLEKLKEAYTKCPVNLVDRLMNEKLARSMAIARRCLHSAADGQIKDRAQAMVNWLIPYSRPDAALNPASRVHGSIKRIQREKGFGFIGATDGRELFFHLTALVDRKDWYELQPGYRVSFGIGSNAGGACAIAVELERSEHSA